MSPLTSGQTPVWLLTLSWVLIALGIGSFLLIVVDILRGHKQHMWIMNLVWPITALWAGPVAVYYYFHLGRLSTRKNMQMSQKRGEKSPVQKKTFRQITGLGTTHCGAGCTLGDIIAEWFIAVAIMYTLFGLQWKLFGHHIFAAWVIDYILALLFGVAFQYFTIAPMRNLSVGKGLSEALKADFLSLTAWQVGMYGWMAIAVFGIFGREIAKSNPLFWFMMQIAMFAGFATSYPVNWWLIKRGTKEAM